MVGVTPAEVIDAARPAAQSLKGRALVDLADEMLEALQLVSQLRLAQDKVERLERGRSSDAQRTAARVEARRLAGEVDLALALLGLGRQQAAPGAALEPPGLAG